MFTEIRNATLTIVTYVNFGLLTALAIKLGYSECENWLWAFVLIWCGGWSILLRKKI